MMSDRGYSNLLNHLHRPSTALSVENIRNSISYYLAHAQPTPTPLAATVVGSPLFRPFSNEKLEAICTAFRYAVHIKMNLLEEEDKTSSTIFLRNLNARLGGWVRGVMKGLQGGQAMMRVASSAGLLMGLEDFESKLKIREGRLRGSVEDEVVLSLAEVMDLYSSLRDSSDWELEFHPDTEGEVDAIALAFIMAANALPLVSTQRLTALPLPIFLPSLLTTIATAFQAGEFLHGLDSSLVGKHHVEDSAFGESLSYLCESPIYTSMGALAKLYARTISAATDSRNRQLWPVLNDTLNHLEFLATKLETDWKHNPVVDVAEENDLDPLIRETMSTVWLILKTFLFTTVMITQSITTAMTYLPSPSSSLPPSLALTILNALSKLSFIISQFGGVTSTSQGGFSELKRVFYSALDVLSVDAAVSEKFVMELCSRVSMPSQVMETAKKAFALACVEQLVPTLREHVIEHLVFPLCVPHLSEPAHRETYESAHSVVLSILVLHAQRVGDGSGAVKIDNTLERPFAERIVPFYVNCLLENSHDGQLSTPQLRLAYAALVRSAGSSGSRKGDALAWYCVQSLLDAVDGNEHKSRGKKPSRALKDENPEDRVHRLQLTLISAISSMPLKLLPQVLEHLKTFIVLENDKDKREELVDASLKEILEKVGDQEKVVVMRWFMDNQEEFGSAPRTAETEVAPRL